MSLGALVRHTDAVRIRQKREWTEIFTDWETRNRYELALSTGETFVAGELGGGLLSTIGRGFLKNRRPFTIEIRDRQGRLALRIERPWTWFLSRVDVFDGAGARLGSVEQRFAVFRRRFELLDAHGARLAELTGPFFRPWTFELTRGGRLVGKIAKRWSGLFREMTSDADDFGLELSPGLGETERLVGLGAVFLIDFLYFEDRD